MIIKESITSIGSFFKPHGIKGELSATFDYDLLPTDLRCVILEIDRIFVPFFIESARRRGASSWLIKLDGVDSEKAAAAFSNHEIFAVTDELPDDVAEEMQDGFFLYDLEGFTLINDGVELGTIDVIDDSTANVLMTVHTSDDELVYVPFAEDFITDFDKDNKVVAMSLPEGLIELNIPSN